MSTTALCLTNLQAITIHNVLAGITELTPADRFQLGGVLRRIRNLGDYDPACNAFRLLEPAEYEVRHSDGAFVLLPDGERKKGYKYDPEVLKGEFPEIPVTSAEQGAIARTLAAILSREGEQAISAGAAAEAQDVAEWTGTLDQVADLLEPKGSR